MKKQSEKRPVNGSESPSMLGNFKPDEISRGENNIALGDFEPNGKRQAEKPTRSRPK